MLRRTSFLLFLIMLIVPLSATAQSNESASLIATQDVWISRLQPDTNFDASAPLRGSFGCPDAPEPADEFGIPFEIILLTFDLTNVEFPIEKARLAAFPDEDDHFWTFDAEIFSAEWDESTTTFNSYFALDRDATSLGWNFMAAQTDFGGYMIWTDVAGRNSTFSELLEQHRGEVVTLSLVPKDTMPALCIVESPLILQSVALTDRTSQTPPRLDIASSDGTLPPLQPPTTVGLSGFEAYTPTAAPVLLVLGLLLGFTLLVSRRRIQ